MSVQKGVLDDLGSIWQESLSHIDLPNMTVFFQMVKNIGLKNSAWMERESECGRWSITWKSKDPVTLLIIFKFLASHIRNYFSKSKQHAATHHFTVI